MLALLVVGTGSAEGENVLRNPSFEAGTERPHGWVFNRRGTDSQIAWDRTRARTGEASVRITNRRATDTGNLFQTLRFDPPLPPGSRVVYRAYAAAKKAGEGPQIIVYHQTASGYRETLTWRGLPGTHDFQPVGGTARLRVATASIVVYLCHYSPGTVWWDDAALEIQPAAVLVPPPRPEVEGPGETLDTGTGLSVTFSPKGSLTATRVNGQRIPLRPQMGGLYLEPFAQPPRPVTGTLRRTEEGIEQTAEDAEVGLRVNARWWVRAGALWCEGAVEDTTARERAVDVVFAVPVEAEGGKWGQNLHEAPLLRAEQSYRLDDHPFAALTGPQGKWGLSLWMWPDRPAEGEFFYEPSWGFGVRFRFGLSPEAGGELKSRAPFAFGLSACDPEWGLRDAARQYYARFPAAFVKRVRREGLWMFGRRPDLPDPEHYAFVEAGPAGWEEDDRYGLYTCPYIIPGQREITGLPELPTSREEAQRIFAAWEPGDDPRRRAGPKGAELKAIIENCLLHAPDGRPQMRLRRTPWGGNSLTFPLNTNPRLFAGEERPTIAKSLLTWCRRVLDEYPSVDGIYVDSLGAWGDYLNFRREHFAFAQVPLTYEPTTGRPALHNKFALLEFLWALGDLLHPRGKIVFANGVHPGRMFHALACDVMGVEGRGRLEQKRAIAYQKPFLLLIYNVYRDPAEVERWFHRCLLYGIYPAFGHVRQIEPEAYAKLVPIFAKYVPVLRQLTAAGWEPVTYATVAVGEGLGQFGNSATWKLPNFPLIERFGPGPGGNLYFAVHNRSDAPQMVTLRVNAKALGLEGAVTFTDLLTGESWACTPQGDALSVTFPLGPNTTRPLTVGPRPRG